VLGFKNKDGINNDDLHNNPAGLEKNAKDYLCSRAKGYPYAGAMGSGSWGRKFESGMA
jgi:hypothetical protein